MSHHKIAFIIISMFVRVRQIAVSEC